MKISELYDLWFYGFYRLFQRTAWPWFSYGKTAICIAALELFFLVGVLTLYGLLSKQSLPLGAHTKVVTIVTSVVLSLANYSYFVANDRWQKCVAKYNRLFERDNVRSQVVFWLVNLSIMGFLLFVVYLKNRRWW